MRLQIGKTNNGSFRIDYFPKFMDKHQFVIYGQNLSDAIKKVLPPPFSTGGKLLTGAIWGKLKTFFSFLAAKKKC